MIKMANLKPQENVLEIGPGKGALTRELLQEGANVFAVEKDFELAKFLNDKFLNDINDNKRHLKVIQNDINDINNKFLKDISPYKIIANIPYYITGEIIRKFLECKSKPVSLTLLVQREVAQRAVSDKGSMLSMAIAFYGTAKISKKVPASCFEPKPKVDSAILHIDVKRPPLHCDLEKEFFYVIQTGFAHKRKKLVNNLQTLISKGALEEFLISNNIPPKTRAEDLSFKQWIALVEFINDNKRHAKMRERGRVK